MRHRRGIDLMGADDEIAGQKTKDVTFADLPEWYSISGKCGGCGEMSMLERWELERRFGKSQQLKPLEQKLRCDRCGNQTGNHFVFGHLSRD
ncbi:hypothetical protein QE369_003229 [Agrobacterium larrymoorei]|uniref:Uncharacterized protein n=1 Tax=Agrobacterium larrymoorei TaxID=160699 RepID=A0AAJ2EVZ8_9HYPH|nr:hypothetical protein [Agrobacterium larrymoorei]MDR6103032.1 hypothetical protein [Agrobacterium larrymoorei]